MKKLLMMIGAAAAVGAMLPLSAMADAVRVYDVDDYVQDGLVLHFDGIRNAGATALHDPNATTWVNLGSGGSVNDATLKEKESSDAPMGASAGSWCDKGYTFNALNYFEIGGEVSLGKAVTVQMATKYDYSAVTNAFNGKGLNWPVFFGAIDRNADDFVIFGDKITESTPQRLRFKFYNNNGTSPTESYPDVAQSWNGLALSAIYDGNNKRMSLSPTYRCEWKQNDWYHNNISDKTTHFAIGTGQSTSAEQKKRMLVGNVYSVKLYDRVLSEEELDWNQTIDDQRYRMENPPSLDDVNIVLLPGNLDLGERITDYIGKYKVSGSHTFTAPESVRKGDYQVWRPTGYTIETWDGSSWGAAVTNSGASYTATDAGKVRLTWIWTLTDEIAFLGSYNVGDYVQDGLVLHFDGIRNAGADAPHDNERHTWKNLVAGQPDATFSSNDYGYWKGGNAFYFEGYGRNCYAQLDAAVTLSPNLTIQLVTDIDTAEMKGASGDKNRWPSYFHTGDSSDLGLYGDAVDYNTPTWIKFKSQGSNRPNVNNWGGKYVTAILDGSVGYLTETANYANRVSNAGNGFGSISKRYCWGGSAHNASRAIKGAYHAVRVYTTALSEDQLARNMAIDEARFRSQITLVNGEIGETGTCGESSLPGGAYNIQTGSWTFAAEPKSVDGRTYKPHLTVETLTDGEWVQTAKLWTDSYTVDKAALGSSRIRLTWTWEIRPGLIISFH